MLYTVRPLERIYADPSTFRPARKEAGKSVSYGVTNSGEQNGPEYREVILPNGRIITRREGEGFVVERINSTDMKDYLNTDYAPGKSYKEQGGYK